IVLIQDNLNTHNPSSFYEVLDAPEAFALSQRFEMVYTPKKASWLNMAEIELSALSKQCLDRRISQMRILTKEVTAWSRKRNHLRTKITWQFTKSKAREKLSRFYDDIKN
ncbi:MAG: transposase, partial [Nanoarchaeota archaeon]